MSKPELDRVRASRNRQLVHEALDRKHIVIGAERAHRRYPKRHLRNEVMHHMGVGECVDRDRIAIAAAFRQWNRLRRRHREGLGHMLGRQHAAGAARPHRMGIAPDLEVPVRDLAVLVERGLQLRHHGRAVRLPGMFLLARPLHAHGHAGHRVRDQRRIRRGIVGAVMAIATGALDMDQVDTRRRHLQHLRNALTVRIDALRVGPNRHCAVRELRDRAGRPDRPMRLIRPRVAGFDRLAPDDRRIAAFKDRRILRWKVGEDISQIVLLRQLCRLLPLGRRGKRVHRLDRQKFLARDHGEEIAIAHDLDDARHFFDRRRIVIDQFRAIARRPHDPRMHHARQPHILNIGGTPGHLGRNIDSRHRLAHHLERRWIL